MLRLISTCVLIILLLLGSAAFPFEEPKLLICSDSTTANYTSGVLQGWGFYVGEYLSVPVVNLAKNGRSTRSFIREGLWAELLKRTRPGDWVVVEMGHNDNGDPSKKNTNTTKASRSTLRGVGNNTVIGNLPDGKTEVVHSFGWYLRQMIDDVRSKQGIPLISGPVPQNNFHNTIFQTDWPFAKDAEAVAKEKAVQYIDHTKYTVERYQALGPKVVNSYFPQDHTHTNSVGARVNAETFMTAVKCGGSELNDYLNEKSAALSQEC